MKIGILAAGTTPEHLSSEFSTYADMFIQALQVLHPEVSFEAYDVRDNEFPESHAACDSWLITGSRSAVYENTPWMQGLQALIRTINEHKQSLVGICFGHQIIAQALGGVVDRYQGGWGVGIHRYEVTDTMAQVQLGKKNFAVCAFHQDQILEKPSLAKVFARSDFCEFAGLLYESHILTVQGHPEFSRKFEGCLLDMYDKTLSPDILSQARDSLYSEDLQSSQMLAWIGAFLTQTRFSGETLLH
ncbi:Carbamoyl-phosphate synthase small chain [Marinomonas spartinae]|uniref:glutamine amidotransferase-related protein n=1 Tax=Marinomonas spartinae TaxID=1792290 RepID=UPI000808B447|nr:glutamine amidotransferase [Marinomonas spartinae]SBS30466.1 Carbamoyl-phosphate synthase small chain [Marinomonas spartinae]